MIGPFGLACGNRPTGVDQNSTRTVATDDGSGAKSGSKLKKLGSDIKKFGKRLKKNFSKKPKPPTGDYATAQAAADDWQATQYDIEFISPQDAQQAEDNTEAQTSQFACGTRSTLFAHNSIASKRGRCSYVTMFDEEKNAAWSVKRGILHQSLQPQVLKVTLDKIKGVAGITDQIVRKYAGKTFGEMLQDSGIDTTKALDFCEIRKRNSLVGKFVKESQCDASVGPQPNLLRDFINNKNIPGLSCNIRAEVFSFDDLDDSFFGTMHDIKNRGGIPIVLLFLKNQLTWHYEAIIRINRDKVFLRNTNKHWDIWNMDWFAYRAMPQHTIDKFIAAAVLDQPYSFVAIFPQ
ncbi:MAG: hypothetical protein AAF310_04610 [Myxococcota bacterium]